MGASLTEASYSARCNCHCLRLPVLCYCEIWVCMRVEAEGGYCRMRKGGVVGEQPKAGQTIRKFGKLHLVSNCQERENGIRNLYCRIFVNCISCPIGRKVCIVSDIALRLAHYRTIGGFEWW